jgi:hypothetical protein
MNQGAVSVAWITNPSQGGGARRVPIETDPDDDPAGEQEIRTLTCASSEADHPSPLRRDR